MRLTPDPALGCFVCGGANPRGMHLEFEQDDAARKIRGRFTLGAEYQGGEGFLHGGVIATLLDEVMTKMNRFWQIRAVTAELNVEYLKPVRVGVEFVVEGWETRAEGRNHFREGEIRDLQGVVLARGRGRFVDLGAARTPRADKPGDERRGESKVE